MSAREAASLESSLESSNGGSLLILAPYLTRRHSGTAQSTINLIHALHEAGCEVHVLAFEVERDVLPAGVAVTILAAPPRRRALWRISRLLLCRDYRVSLASVALPAAAGAYTQSMEFALAFRAIDHATPLVTHFGHVLAHRESRDSSDLGAPWHQMEIAAARSTERRCYALRNTTHLVSTPLVAAARAEEFRLRASDFVTAPLGLDVRRFSDPSTRNATRARLGIEGGSIAIVAVARMVAWKQLDWVVEAAGELARRHAAPVHLILMGDGDERPRLEALAARQLPLVTHFPGHGDPVPYLAAADIFALPSTIESFGMVYAEAMCMGLPCIGLRNAPPAVLSSAQDVIAHGITGLLVSSPHELAEALQYLAMHDADRTRMGANAADFARAEYAAATYAARIRALCTAGQRAS